MNVPKYRKQKPSNNESQGERIGQGAHHRGNSVPGEKKQADGAQPNQHDHADGPIYEYRDRRGHGGTRHCFLRVIRVIPGEIVNATDIASHSTRGKEIEEHPDEIVMHQHLEWRLESQGTSQNHPAYSAYQLGKEIDDQDQDYIGNVRRRERVYKTLDMDSSEKIAKQPRADQVLHQQNQHRLSFFHPSSGGCKSAWVSSLVRPSTKTLRPSTRSRPSL